MMCVGKPQMFSCFLGQRGKCMRLVQKGTWNKKARSCLTDDVCGNIYMIYCCLGQRGKYMRLVRKRTWNKKKRNSQTDDVCIHTERIIFITHCLNNEPS